MKSGLRDLRPLRLSKVVGIKIVRVIFLPVIAASSINQSGLWDLQPLCLLKVVSIKIIMSLLIITDFIFIFFFLPNSYNHHHFYYLLTPHFSYPLSCLCM